MSRRCLTSSRTPVSFLCEFFLLRALPRVKAPVCKGNLLRPSHRLRDDLGEFDQIAGRVREEGKLAADGVEFERLGHDLDTAGSEVGDGLLDIRHVDTEMVIAGMAETIAKVRIPGGVNR